MSDTLRDLTRAYIEARAEFEAVHNERPVPDGAAWVAHRERWANAQDAFSKAEYALVRECVRQYAAEQEAAR